MVSKKLSRKEEQYKIGDIIFTCMNCNWFGKLAELEVRSDIEEEMVLIGLAVKTKHVKQQLMVCPNCCVGLLRITKIVGEKDK